MTLQQTTTRDNTPNPTREVGGAPKNTPKGTKTTKEKQKHHQEIREQEAFLGVCFHVRCLGSWRHIPPFVTSYDAS